MAKKDAPTVSPAGHSDSSTVSAAAARLGPLLQKIQGGLCQFVQSLMSAVESGGNLPAFALGPVEEPTALDASDIIVSTQYLRDLGLQPDAERLEVEWEELDKHYAKLLEVETNRGGKVTYEQVGPGFPVVLKQSLVVSVLVKELTGTVKAMSMPVLKADESEGAAGGGVFYETTPPPEGDQFIFARSGSGYFIVGFGERGNVRKLKGFDHIAMLVKTPRQCVLMSTLLQGEDTIPAVDARTRQPALDQQAKQDLYQRLREVTGELERAIEEHDNVEQEHCGEEIARLQRELAAAVGLGGKDRNLNSEADKLRPTVYANLARAYKALRESIPSMKELADHFEAAISAEGATYVYRPAGETPAWSSDLPPEVAR